MKKYIYILFLCLLTGCFNTNTATCVPDTLARLSKCPPISHPTSSKRFAKILHTTSDGTWNTDVEDGWKKVYPHNPLEMILKREDNTFYEKDDCEIDDITPYLWIGRHEQGYHCCLLYFRPSHVILSHSQFIPGTTNYYTETRSLEWMVTNSWTLYRVK